MVVGVRRVLTYVGTIAVATTLSAVGAHPAAAAPNASGSSARIVSTTVVSPREVLIDVASPATGMREKLTVLLPAQSTQRRSTVYLLDGAGKSGPVTSSEWIAKGRAREFFADKNVIAVLPVGGAGTFFSDWSTRDPRLGRPRWETFLTRELPPLIDRTFGGTGRAAVAGLSMGGQSALSLLARNPRVYSGAASYSGCPAVDFGANPAYVYATVGYAGGNATNMWGPVGSKEWVEHDPSNHLDGLRGKNIFLSVGDGVLGPLDRNRVPSPGQSVAQSIVQSIVLEKAANGCTRQFDSLLTRNGIRHTARITEVGTHSWNYWAQALRDSWPTLRRGL